MSRRQSCAEIAQEQPQVVAINRTAANTVINVLYQIFIDNMDVFIQPVEQDKLQQMLAYNIRTAGQNANAKIGLISATKSYMMGIWTSEIAHKIHSLGERLGYDIVLFDRYGRSKRVGLNQRMSEVSLNNEQTIEVDSEKLKEAFNKVKTTTAVAYEE
jgi:hypothetical protein